jgi:hypothetical protein
MQSKITPKRTELKNAKPRFKNDDDFVFAFLSAARLIDSSVADIL